jgi:hypothetical protein
MDRLLLALIDLTSKGDGRVESHACDGQLFVSKFEIRCKACCSTERTEAVQHNHSPSWHLLTNYNTLPSSECLHPYPRPRTDLTAFDICRV